MSKQLASVYLVVVLGLGILAGCQQSAEVRRDNFLRAGKSLLQKKDYARATIEFRNAIQAMPRDAEAYYQLGLASAASGDLQGAVLAFEKALQLNPKHRGATIETAKLLMSTGDSALLRQAQEKLKALLQQDASNVDALHTLALTEMKLSDPEDALQHLERAIALAPGQLSVSITLAQAKLRENNPNAAEEVLKKARQVYPKSAEAAVVLGSFYASQHRTAEALEQYQQALSLNPNDGEALERLATLQSSLGQTEQAEQTLKRLAGIPDPSYRHLYAIFLFQQGKRAEAIREFERLVQADRQDRLSRTRLVSAYRQSSREADARRVLDDALKKNPNDMDALLQRAEMSVEAHQYAQAQADVNRVLRLRPDAAEVHYVLARVYQAQGQGLTYRSELTEALRLNPYLLPVRLELAQTLTMDKATKEALAVLDAAPASQANELAILVQRNWALWAAGNVQAFRKGIDLGLSRARTADLLIQDGMWKLGAGNSAGAQAAFDEALKIDSDNLQALALRSRAYIAQHQSSIAVQKLQEYAEAHPRSAPAKHLLASVLAVNGNREQARATVAAAKAADPKYTNADLLLVQMDAIEGKWEHAATILNGLLATDSNNATAHDWLGGVEVFRGRPSAAIAQYEKAVELNPQNATALNNLAYLLAVEAKRPDDALKYAQKAQELAPENPAFADTLGWVLYQKGLYDIALKHLRLAAANSGNIVWKYHLAMAYAKSGSKEQARDTLNAALKVNSKVPEAQAASQVVNAAN